MRPTTAQIDQYNALTQGVGFVPLTGRTIIEVTGPDRLQILQSFTTNDVKRLAPGQGCEAFVTSPQGKTLGHVFIFCEADQHVLDTTPDQSRALIDHFNRYIITEDAYFTDKTAEFTNLLVAGPKAAALIEKLSGESPPTEMLAHRQTSIAAQAVVVRHVEYAGPQSYFLQIATPQAPAVIAALHQAGATACEHAAVESARLEARFPLFGLDITTDNLPQEVGRDREAISFTKGCYLGQETVARIDAIGHVNRLLIGVRFAADVELLPAGTELLANGQSVGHVTSSAWSPRLQSPLALAYVRRAQAKTETKLDSVLGAAVAVGFPLAAKSGT